MVCGITGDLLTTMWFGIAFWIPIPSCRYCYFMLVAIHKLPNKLSAKRGAADWLASRMSEFWVLFNQSKAEIKPLGENSYFIVPENYMTSECREAIKELGQNADELAQLLLATLAYKSLGCRRKQDKHGDSFERTWFPLSAKILKKGYWNYSAVVFALLIKGFIEKDGVGIKGVTCIKYRLGKACFKEYTENKNFEQDMEKWIKSIDKNGDTPIPAPLAFVRNPDFNGQKNFVNVKLSHPKIVERINESRQKVLELPDAHKIQEFLLNGRDSRGKKFVSLADDILTDARDEYEESVKAIKRLRKKSQIIKAQDKADHQLWQAQYLHDSINSGNAYYVVDGTSQRAHHPCTILPNRFMKHLRICGEKVAESDFRNSQPAIFAYVMDRILSGDIQFIEELKNLMLKAACVGKTRPIIGNEIRKFRRNSLLKRYPNHKVLRKEIGATVDKFVAFIKANEIAIRAYINDCYAGKTYGKIQDALRKLGFKDPAKRIVFKNMFGHSSECSLAQKAAKNVYPEAMAAIDSLKEVDYGITSKVAQAIESDEMFNRVLPEIQESNPFVITRHDSVITLPSRIEASRESMDRAFDRKLQTKLSKYQHNDGQSAKWWEAEQEAENQRVAERDSPTSTPPSIYVAAEQQSGGEVGSQSPLRSPSVAKHRLSHWLIP